MRTETHYHVTFVWNKGFLKIYWIPKTVFFKKITVYFCIVNFVKNLFNFVLVLYGLLQLQLNNYFSSNIFNCRNFFPAKLQDILNPQQSKPRTNRGIISHLQHYN